MRLVDFMWLLGVGLFLAWVIMAMGCTPVYGRGYWQSSIEEAIEQDHRDAVESYMRYERTYEVIRNNPSPRQQRRGR